MKSILFSIALLLINNLAAQIWLVDPLEAIYPDVNKTESFNNRWVDDYPQGVNANVHLLIKAPKGEKIKLSASIDGKELDVNVWSKLIDVPVEQNTGLDSRTEQFINEINPHVIRRAPFRIFEVIEPLSTNSTQTTNNYTAFRLSVPFDLIDKPGTYKVNINVHSVSFEKQAIFKIEIHPIELPQLSESKFFYTNWFNLNKMEESHNLTRWSDSWFRMLEKYAQLMAHGRQNCIIIPGELITYNNGKFILDKEKMLGFINVFRKYGFQYFESPHLLYRGDNDDWGDPELKVILTKKRYYSENGKQDIEKIVKLIREFTIGNGLTNSWLQHISDEPTSVNAGCYSDLAGQIKEIFPEIKIMEATNDREGIAGAIDIWCPIINDFEENELFFREREEFGEKVLVYTCLVPGGKWLNRTLDMEKLRQVYFGWGAAHYNTGGYLHWGLNQYHADPFEQSVVKHPSPVASANNFLPAGDTHIVYPGQSGPLSSIRFEAHRMGCEDYELLQKLKVSDPKLHDKLISKLFRTYTDYNLNLKDYRKTRKKLLKALQ